MGELERALSQLVEHVLPEIAGTLRSMSTRIERLERGNDRPDLARMSLDVTIARWAAAQAEQVTIAQSTEYVRRMAVEMGWKTLADVTPESIRAYIARRRKAGVIDQTVRRECARLGGMFRWLKREDPRITSPLTLVTLPAVTRGEGKAPLEVEQVQRLLASLTATDARRYRRLVYLTFAGTALRPSQLFKMRVRHLQLDADPAVLMLPARVNKGKADHTMAVHPGIVVPLRAWIEGKADDELVFPRTVTLRAFRADLERARVERPERYGFSSLRKYVATTLADVGVPVDGAQRILGHKDPMTTQQHYQRPGLRIQRQHLARVPLTRTDAGPSGAESTGSNGDSASASASARESHLGDLNPGPMLYEGARTDVRAVVGECSGEHRAADDALQSAAAREAVELVVNRLTRGILAGLMQAGVVSERDLVEAVADSITPRVLAQALARRRTPTKGQGAPSPSLAPTRPA